jgi:hypothetical protein
MVMKTGGTPGDTDARSGKKSAPLNITPGRAIVNTANNQDFAN